MTVMEPDQAQKIAIMAGAAAVLAALATGRLPRWLRIILVSSLAALACAAGLLGYRYATHPVTLTVATGSIDGDATRLMSAVAAEMAAKESPVRLKVVDKGTALDAVNAFAAGETDLAIVRADVGDLSAARTVVVMTYAVVLIAVPPGSTIDSMDGLKGKTVGVIAGPVNQKLTAAIVKAYDLDRAKVIFKDISPSDALQALQSKQIHALLVVMPISEKYLGMLRDVLPRSAKMKLGLVPIDLAGAIAATARTYESYDLPKGTIRGSPAIPDEDLTTLRVPFHLVANKKLADNVVAALTQTMMEVPRDLVGEYPLLAQIGAPSSDKDAYIPIHPGAAIYFNGEQQSFLDKHADKLFYLFMLLGFFASMLAAAWKFMMKDPDGAEDAPLARLTRLMDQIGTANSESELANAERNIDEILKAQLEKYSRGEAEAADCAALGLAMQRLERLIGQRRAGLASRPRAAV
jgi:TRAP transporter TAXI family solute receptor